jgi:hypothetical protein
VYGNLAYSKPGLEVGIPILGGVAVGQSSVLMYDGGLQLSGSGGRGGRGIVPFVQAGVGGMRYSFDIAPIHLTATNLAFNAGLGVNVPLGSNLGIRLMAKDYIGKFDAQEVSGININTEDHSQLCRECRCNPGILTWRGKLNCTTQSRGGAKRNSQCSLRLRVFALAVMINR